MKRATRDKAKKQHEFMFDQACPWKTGPMSLPIESYSDYASFSDLAASVDDEETIEALNQAAMLSYKQFNDW